MCIEATKTLMDCRDRITSRQLVETLERVARQSSMRGSSLDERIDARSLDPKGIPPQ